MNPIFYLIGILVIVIIFYYAYSLYTHFQKKDEYKNKFNTMHHSNDFESIITYHSLDA